MEPNITMHHICRYYNVSYSYYCSFCSHKDKAQVIIQSSILNYCTKWSRVAGWRCRMHGSHLVSVLFHPPYFPGFYLKTFLLLLSLLQVLSCRNNQRRTLVGSSCRNIQLFRVLSDTLISWSAGVRMEQLWPKAVHHQIRAKQSLVRIRWVVGRWLVGASVSSVVLSTQGSLHCSNESTKVSAPDSEDMRRLCRCLTPLSLIGLRCTHTGSVGSKQKTCAIDSFLNNPEDGLFPSEEMGNRPSSVSTHWGTVSICWGTDHLQGR